MVSFSRCIGLVILATLTAGCSSSTVMLDPHGNAVHCAYVMHPAVLFSFPSPWEVNARVRECVERYEREGYVEAADVTLGIFVEWPTVARVLSGTPAAKAGITAGDLLRELDGEPLATFADFVQTLRRSAPGDRLTITVERNGQSVTASVVLDPRRDGRTSGEKRDSGSVSGMAASYREIVRLLWEEHLTPWEAAISVDYSFYGVCRAELVALSLVQNWRELADIPDSVVAGPLKTTKTTNLERRKLRTECASPPWYKYSGHGRYLH